MALSDRDLSRRARRAYELGRLRHALLALGYVIPMVVISALCCGHHTITLVTGPLLALTVVALSWYGRVPGRAVLPGLAAGAVALAVPVIESQVGIFLGFGCARVGLPACMVGGVVAGVIIARSAARQERGGAFLLAAAAVAALPGWLGCAQSGMTGVLAMTTVLVAVSVPSWFVLKRAA